MAAGCKPSRADPGTGSGRSRKPPGSGGLPIVLGLIGRLRLPRPVTIGLAAPFARPSRSAFTLVVVGLGATAVILMVGLGGELAGLALAGVAIAVLRAE